MAHRVLWLLFFLSGSILLSPGAAAESLIESPRIARDTVLPEGMSARTHGSLNAALLAQLRSGDRDRFSLPDGQGQEVPVQLDTLRALADGFVATGRPLSDSLGTAAIACRGDAVFGILRYRDGQALYLNGDLSGRDARVARITNAPVAPCETVSSRLVTFDSSCLQEIDPDTAEVDVLIIYNRSAREEAGGRDGMLALIDLTFADTNQILQNSGVDVALRLLRAEEVAYTNLSGPDPILTKLINPTDGVLDEVHVLRDIIGADVVQFWSSRIGGQSQVLGENPFNSTLVGDGFSTAGSPRADYPYVLNELISAHEFGHTLGCNHNREASLPGLFPFSFGFVSPSFSDPEATRTLMAIPPPNPRVPFYSNPDIYLGGEALGSPAGTPNAADNAQTIARGANCMQNYRNAIAGAMIEDSAARLLAFFREDQAAFVFGQVVERASDAALSGAHAAEDWRVFSRIVPNRVLARFSRAEQRLYLRGRFLGGQAAPLAVSATMPYVLNNAADTAVAAIDGAGNLLSTGSLESTLQLRVADQSDSAYYPGNPVHFSVTFNPMGLPPESLELQVNLQNDLRSAWRIEDVAGVVPDNFPGPDAPASVAEPWVLSWETVPDFPFSTHFALVPPADETGLRFVDVRARYTVPGSSVVKESILYQIELAELPFAPGEGEGEGEGEIVDGEGEGEGVLTSEGEAGTRAIDDAVLRYVFDEGAGTVLHDISGVGAAYDLVVADPDAAMWVENGLQITAATVITTELPASKVRERVGVSNAISLEAWVTPDNLNQSGPAIIATISQNTLRRNLSLGQAGAQYELRLRSTATSSNGLPAVTTAEGAALLRPQHIVYTRNASGVARVYVDGEVLREDLRAGTLDNWNSNYAFALANEVSLIRPWLGTYHELTVYDRALQADEIDANYRGNPLAGMPDEDVDSPSAARTHSADSDGDGGISLSELLAVVQVYNLGSYRCAAADACVALDCDFDPRDGAIGLGELLRIVQFYNADGLTPCEDAADGFCPRFERVSN